MRIWRKWVWCLYRNISWLSVKNFVIYWSWNIKTKRRGKKKKMEKNIQNVCQHNKISKVIWVFFHVIIPTWNCLPLIKITVHFRFCFFFLIFSFFLFVHPPTFSSLHVHLYLGKQNASRERQNLKKNWFKINAPKTTCFYKKEKKMPISHHLINIKFCIRLNSCLVVIKMLFTFLLVCVS